jgi:NAD(P)H dehydrogenase (quinone)
MKILMVYAHPEPKSFNGAMKDLAVSTLIQQGHEVVVSDLYAMGFSAEAGRADFVTQRDGPLDLQKSQLHAATHRGFASDIQREIEKLQNCDLLMLQFPLWWFSIPGILKGWIDRVFAFGVTYGEANLAGRRAMVATTTGGPAAVYTAELAGTIEECLRSLLVGTLAFCGLEVLPTFVGYGAATLSDEERTLLLESYAKHLGVFASKERLE